MQNVEMNILKAGYLRDDSRDIVYYFREKSADLWLLYTITDKSKSPHKDNLAYIHAVAGDKVSERFMEELALIYPNQSQYVSESVIRGLVESKGGNADQDGNLQGVGEYYPRIGSVVVDGREYFVGETVHARGVRYSVVLDPDGYGMLKVDPSTLSPGVKLEYGERVKTDTLVHFDYRGHSYMYRDNRVGLDITNRRSSTSNQKGGVRISDSGTLTRRIETNRTEGARYFERFNIQFGESSKFRDVTEGLLDTYLYTDKESNTIPSTPAGTKYLFYKGSGPIGAPMYREVYPENKYGANWVYIHNATLGYARHVIGLDIPNNKFYAYTTKKGVTNNIIINNHKNAGSSRAAFFSLRSKYGLPSTYYEGTIPQGFRRYQNNVNYKNMLRVEKGKSPQGPEIAGGRDSVTEIMGTVTIPGSELLFEGEITTSLRRAGDSVPRGSLEIYAIGPGNVKRQIYRTTGNHNYGKISRRITNVRSGTYTIYAKVTDFYPDTFAAAASVTNASVGYRELIPSEEREKATVIVSLTTERGPAVEFEGGGTTRRFTEEGNHHTVTVNIPPDAVVQVHIDFDTERAHSSGFNSGTVVVHEGRVRYWYQRRSLVSMDAGGGILGGIVTKPNDWWEGMPPDWDSETKPPEEGDTPTNIEEPYFWIDAIVVGEFTAPPIDDDVFDRIVENATCEPIGTEIVLQPSPGNSEWSGDYWKEIMDASSVPRVATDDIHMKIVNPTDKKVAVEVWYKVMVPPDCRGFINYYNGGFEIYNDDIWDRDPEGAYLTVTPARYKGNHIVVGGCNGSYAEVRLLSNGRLVDKRVIHEGAFEEFAMSTDIIDRNLPIKVEVETFQKGLKDNHGVDTRSKFELHYLNFRVRLDPYYNDSFDSVLEFFIDGEKVMYEDEIGTGVHHFPVKKGKHDYTFRFRTEKMYDNWDYAKIEWLRLTNWMSETTTVVPYCEEGGGDKCIELLINRKINSLPGEVLPTKYGCLIVRAVDEETGKEIKTVHNEFMPKGYHWAKAPTITGYRLVSNEDRKYVYVDGTRVCTEVVFFYRKAYLDCVITIHEDKDNGALIARYEYRELVPGTHKFTHKQFKGYRPYGQRVQYVTVEYKDSPPLVCQILVFEYEPYDKQDEELWCITEIHRERDRPSNILTKETHSNLKPGKYTFESREFEGYRALEPKKQVVEIIEGETSKLICVEVIFEYEKIPLGCVIVRHIDIENDRVLDTEYYARVPVGEHTYYSKEFEGYELVSESKVTIQVEEGLEVCHDVEFHYIPLEEGTFVRDRIWIFT